MCEMDKLKEMYLDAAASLKEAVSSGKITVDQAQQEIDVVQVMVELLTIAVDTSAGTGKVSDETVKEQRRERLIAMWAEACRRAGQPVCPIPEEIFGIAGRAL